MRPMPFVNNTESEHGNIGSGHQSFEYMLVGTDAAGQGKIGGDLMVKYSYPAQRQSVCVGAAEDQMRCHLTGLQIYSGCRIESNLAYSSY